MSAYDQGWLAYENGLDVSYVPYSFDTREHTDWVDGWFDAQRENEWGFF